MNARPIVAMIPSGSSYAIAEYLPAADIPCDCNWWAGALPRMAPDMAGAGYTAMDWTRIEKGYWLGYLLYN